MPDSLPRILVVEDDDAIRMLLVAALRREALDVDSASDGTIALALTRTRPYTMIVLDLMMPRMNGYDFLDAFRATTPDARPIIIVVTAFDQPQHARLGAAQVHAVMRKPFDLQQLVEIVRDVAVGWKAHEPKRAPSAWMPTPSPSRSTPSDQR